MSEPSLGRIAQPLADFIEWFIGARLDYHAFYPCTVITQNADGSLALLADDERARGFGADSVHIRTGIPGTTATVAAGSRVLLGFDAGDPKRPYAGLWDTSTMIDLTITATGTVTVDAPTINLATVPRLAVARMTDPCTAGPFIGTITVGSFKANSG